MYGMLKAVNVFTHKPQAGCYITPDGQGHIHRNGREWDAWRDDKPGVTAHCDTLQEAANYAHYGE